MTCLYRCDKASDPEPRATREEAVFTCLHIACADEDVNEISAAHVLGPGL